VSSVFRIFLERAVPLVEARSPLPEHRTRDAVLAPGRRRSLPLALVKIESRGIHCYNPEYTFVEKVQAVVRKNGQFKGTGKSQRISSDTTTTFINFSTWMPCRNS
jgi:hypothetical protein